MGDTATRPTAEQNRWTSAFTAIPLERFSEGDAPGGAPGGTAAAPKAGISIDTPFGVIACLPPVQATVEPILTKAAEAFARAEELQETLEIELSKLEDLEEKYKDTAMSDVDDDVGRHTSGPAKAAALQARGASDVAEGFGDFLSRLKRDLVDASENLAIADEDVDERNLRDESARIRQLGLDMQGALSKLIDVAVDAAKVELDVANPAGWIDLGKDLFKDFLTEENHYLREAAEMEATANRMRKESLIRKAKLARKKYGDMKNDVLTWQKIVAHTEETKKLDVDYRDTSFDAGKSEFKMQDMKDGMEQAQKVYAMTTDAVAGAHNVRSALVNLQRTYPKPEAWLADPHEGRKVMDAFIDGTKDIYGPLEKRLAWIKQLSARFDAMYKEAGDQMARSSGKGH